MFLNNKTISNVTYQVLFQTEIWISLSLSSVSLITLFLFMLVYAIARIRARDHSRETRRKAIKKLCKQEYLVLSYSISLMLSHLITIIQKALQFLLVEKIIIVPTNNFCLVVAILKHYFWLLTIFHCGAYSFKLYIKFRRTMDNSIIERNDWLKPILLTLAFIIIVASSIVACSLILHFSIKVRIRNNKN